jgi:hypothetical protein
MWVGMAALLSAASAKWIDFEKIGAIANNSSMEAAVNNGNLLNATLNALQPGDTFFLPNKTFHTTGGMKATKLLNVTIQIDGTLAFINDRASWPKKDNGDVEECILLTDIERVVFTSSGRGIIDGNGTAWWGAIKFLKHMEDRPRLLHVIRSKDVLVENLLLKNSPYWTTFFEQSDGLLIRHADIDARWTNADYHTLIDLQAFNTDGWDVTGRNVHIHDSVIWNQDDCIAVKDGSANMLFERISCSGLGLVIGSIGLSKVQNITFRDCVLPRTVKGIYMKTRWYDDAALGDSASISNILYQNITMDRPQQFAIWMGPAQQTGQPCSLLWPITNHATCSMSGTQTWSNIVLKDVFINSPEQSPGVLLGNATNPMHNVIFDNVVVTNAPADPWGDDFYFCDGMQGTAMGGTSPVPPCFKKA